MMSVKISACLLLQSLAGCEWVALLNLLSPPLRNLLRLVRGEEQKSFSSALWAWVTCRSRHFFFFLNNGPFKQRFWIIYVCVYECICVWTWHSKHWRSGVQGNCLHPLSHLISLDLKKSHISSSMKISNTGKEPVTYPSYGEWYIAMTKCTGFDSSPNICRCVSCRRHHHAPVSSPVKGHDDVCTPPEWFMRSAWRQCLTHCETTIGMSFCC